MGSQLRLHLSKSGSYPPGHVPRLAPPSSTGRYHLVWTSIAAVVFFLFATGLLLRRQFELYTLHQFYLFREEPSLSFVKPYQVPGIYQPL